MVAQKYQLTETKKTLNDGTVVYRIQATADFSDVKAGDLGGWVQSQKNLSQLGDCWIYNEAIARDNSTVKNAAALCDHAIIKDHATAGKNAVITDKVVVGKYATVLGGLQMNQAVIGGHSIIEGCITQKAQIRGNVHVEKGAIISGKIVIEGDEWVPPTSVICTKKDFLFLREKEFDITATCSFNDTILLAVKSKFGEEVVFTLNELKSNPPPLLVRNHPQVFEKIKDTVISYFKKHLTYTQQNMNDLLLIIITILSFIVLFVAVKLFPPSF